MGAWDGDDRRGGAGKEGEGAGRGIGFGMGQCMLYGSSKCCIGEGGIGGITDTIVRSSKDITTLRHVPSLLGVSK